MNVRVCWFCCFPVFRMRFVSLSLFITWGTLSFLGHAGVHSLADATGICCDNEHCYGSPEPLADEGETQGNSYECHTRGNHVHHRHRYACTHTGSRGHGAETPIAISTEAGSKRRLPHRPHDSRHCRICDWFLKCQSQQIELVSIEASTAVAFHVEADPCDVAESDSLTPSSRGPPQRA